MEDDILAALTQEIKREVVENYFYERRLREEQVDRVKELAEHASHLEEELFRRFCRIYEVLQESRFLGIPCHPCESTALARILRRFHFIIELPSEIALIILAPIRHQT